MSDYPDSLYFAPYNRKQIQDILKIESDFVAVTKEDSMEIVLDYPILEEILRERNRQYQKWGHTDFESVARFVLNERNLPTDLPPAILKFLGLRTMEIVLNEEVGEVSRAILEDDLAGLEKELIQVAAVAVAMVEYLRGY